MGEVSAASVRCVCALALLSTSCPVCGRGLIGVTAGQAVVTATQLFSIVIGGGGERRFATSDQRSSSGQNWGGGTHTFMNYHHINKYAECADAHTTSSFRYVFFLWIDLCSFASPRVFTHIQWPWCDQVRSLFCLIRLDLSVSLLGMTWNYTPSCSCAHARLEVGGQSTVTPQSGDPKKHSTFSCFPLWTLLRRRRMRDVFDCKLQFNVVKFFTLFSRSASGATEEANTFQWKLIYGR